VTTPSATIATIATIAHVPRVLPMLIWSPRGRIDRAIIRARPRSAIEEIPKIDPNLCE
jgi:hypothetical protein